MIGSRIESASETPVMEPVGVTGCQNSTIVSIVICSWEGEDAWAARDERLLREHIYDGVRDNRKDQGRWSDS